jgi:hypothetical protein
MSESFKFCVVDSTLGNFVLYYKSGLHDGFIILSITNKMQSYTVSFIAVNGICQACLLLPLAWVSWH